MDLDKKFLKTTEFKKSSYGRLVSMQKRFFDEWATDNLEAAGYPDFKIAYFAILMNIGLEGATNNELAQKICVTKQASSKVIKELENLGLVTSSLHADDSRQVLIKLTKKGKELVVNATEHSKKRCADYEKLVGKKEFEQAMSIMYRIMEFEQEEWLKKKNKRNKSI